MSFNLKKEIPILLIAVTPLVYLLFIWNTLPQTVPVHWNIDGEANDWRHKSSLFLIPLLLPLLTYIILTVRLRKGRGKHHDVVLPPHQHRLKFLTTLIMSVLAVYILYSVKTQSLTNPNIVRILAGVLITVLGSYFRNISPNFFIGIRTPWTLANGDNWRQTHRLASLLWVPGGMLIVLSGFLTDTRWNMTIFLIVIAVLVLIPFGYSFKLSLDRRKG